MQEVSRGRDGNVAVRIDLREHQHCRDSCSFERDRGHDHHLEVQGPMSREKIQVMKRFKVIYDAPIVYCLQQGAFWVPAM